MADLSQVETAIVEIVAAALYPDGTDNPSALNQPVRIYRGWPVPNALNHDLANGMLNVSVYPQDTESRTTRYMPEEIDLPRVAPTLTLTADAETVTVGGTPCVCNAAVFAGGKVYVYPVQASDTLAGIAAALATLINADYPATSSGPVITVANASTRVGGIGNTVKEIRRQKRGFQITCWCPDPETRDALASLIDSALAGIDYLALPDGTAGRMLYERSKVFDEGQENGLYRRDLFYSVEYGTTVTGTAAEIVTVQTETTSVGGEDFPPIKTITFTQE